MKRYWGHFEKREPPEIDGELVALHIGPCDAEGWWIPPHQFSPDCPCHPDLLDMKIPVYEHNEIN